MKINKHVYLLLPVFLWPILWSNGLVPFVPESWLFGISRPNWWGIFIAIFLFEWLMFGYVNIKIGSLENGWKSIGLDWRFFYKNRYWLIPYVLFFLIAAIFAPSYLYGNELPSEGQIIPITPVKVSERVFFVFVSITAGICEEIIFRGVGITILRKLTRSTILAVIITSICFVFIHGPFLGWLWFTQYLIVGIAFALGFLLPKRPRLEILILIHFTADASLAAFIP